MVYVDYLIIIGSDPSLIDTIIPQLDSKFSTKDLGVLSYFCGVEVLATSTSLLPSQQKYVIDLLSKHNMPDSKDVATPLVVGTSLIANDGVTPYFSGVPLTTVNMRNTCVSYHETYT